MPRKKLLLLGGSRFLRPAIESAHRHGYHVITCDNIPGNFAHQIADESYNVSIIDKDAVLKLASSLNVQGILSFATDPGVVTAAYVAERLGLPTSPYDSVCVLQDKALFRNYLRRNDFCTPQFFVVSASDGEMPEISFPAIVKPVDLAGSKGVAKVENMDELAPAVASACEMSRSGRSIVEEYLEQVGYSSGSDSFAVDGEFVILSFDDQHFNKAAASQFVPVAHTWPSTMPELYQTKLRIELQRLISLLNMQTTLFNIEARVAQKDGDAYIMEVSPRAGGNRLAEMLHLASGVDVIDIAVQAAVGDSFDKPTPVTDFELIGEMILHSNTQGQFQSIVIDPIVEKENVAELDLWVNPGDKVQPFMTASDAIGTLVLRFDSAQQQIDLMSSYNEWIKVTVL